MAPSEAFPPPFEGPALSAGDVLDLFFERFGALGGKVATWDDLRSLGDRRWCVEPALGELPREAGAYEDTEPWTAGVGVTRAEAAIAETGSLVVASGPMGRRLASLAPPLHVAVVSPERLVLRLEEGIALVPPGNAAIVTGPSRTADIEGVLVRGVHGPAKVWVVFHR